MSGLLGSEPLLYPSLSASMVDVIRIGYGLLLVATLLHVLPQARRYFLSERWGGYAERGTLVEAVQNPVVVVIALAVWLMAGAALVVGWHSLAAAVINVILARYFFIQTRWTSILRGMGAPGFMAYWLGAAVLLLVYTEETAPQLRGLALLVLQVDFAFIMLSAGMYKFSAGYRHGQGMELGMVNPEWGYWPRFWAHMSPGSWWFRLFDELAWGTEVVAAVLMLMPPTRFLGGLLILLSFIFIATQIRLGWLCEMVIVSCLIFAFPGSFIDAWLHGLIPARAAATASPTSMSVLLEAGLWMYLALLPFARVGLAYNFHARKSLPAAVQWVLDRYTNVFGLIIWRVFSADVTNFFVNVYEQTRDGRTTLKSRWGSAGRYHQVAEAITVTSLFTTLKYYPSNSALFVKRLLRYARTVPLERDSTLVFEYVSVVKRPDAFAFVPAARYEVDPATGSVTEHVIDGTISVHAPAASSPIHEGARPGSYAPLSRNI